MGAARTAFAGSLAVVWMLAGLLLAAPAPALQIHAHRGGPNAEGVAAFGENSMPAFQNAADHGWVIELDLARTSDEVAVAMHDDGLGRTTDCEGDVVAHTLAELSSCRIDRIGIGDARENLAPGDPRLSPIPTLADVLDLLEETGARANIEVKNLTGEDPGFPPAVYSQIAASDVSKQQVIIQNFIPSNLASVPTLLPGVETSLLTPNILNETFGFDWAVEGGYDWVSPEWPVTGEYVARAQAAGLKVAPWTIDDAAGLKQAGAVGARAVITNDPALAERLVGPRPRLLLRVPSRRLVLKPGRVSTVKVRLLNRGDAASGPARVSAGPSNSGIRVLGADSRKVSRIPAGGVRKINFSFRLDRRLRPGPRGKVRYRLSTDGSTAASVLRSVSVRR